MKKEKRKDSGRVKKWQFAISLFAIYWGMLLLMSGIHSGLIVMMEELQWHASVKSGDPILY
ncbi:MAG: sensor histidine kinase, partial [Lachnospiraceae bacterium]|nr:sensor histidine kinase [Lachnospiraceae bacterium]